MDFFFFYTGLPLECIWMRLGGYLIRSSHYHSQSGESRVLLPTALCPKCSQGMVGPSRQHSISLFRYSIIHRTAYFLINLSFNPNTEMIIFVTMTTLFQFCNLQLIPFNIFHFFSNNYSHTFDVPWHPILSHRLQIQVAKKTWSFTNICHILSFLSALLDGPVSNNQEAI